MSWPLLWAPIQDKWTAQSLEVELKRELGRGHPLFGVRLQAIGRSLSSDDVLFAIQDGSGRVASVHLTWKRGTESPPWPYSTRYESLEAWADDVCRELQSDADDQLEIVREALRKWDPIGAHPEWPDCPAKDEYDWYAPAILDMLSGGANEADLTLHLRHIRNDQMGLSGDWVNDGVIANELFRWWSGRR